MNNKAYFENVLNYGDLYLDKVFNVYEGENIIFTCKDKCNNHFLCVCYEFRFKLEWILCKVDVSTIVDIIDNKIDLHTVFIISNSLIKIVSDNSGDHITKFQGTKVDLSCIPVPGAYLKPDISLNQDG